MRNPAKPFACIVWDDAVSHSSEVPEEDIAHAPSRFHTYGWLVRSDTRGVTVASDWRPSDGNYRDRTFIPRGMVVEEILVTLAKPRKRSPKSKPSTSSASSPSSSLV